MSQEERDQQFQEIHDHCFYPEKHKMYHSILQACGCSQSYDSMVESWGYEVLVMSSIGDYQGDYLTLVRDGDRYGYVSFSYGSCSGCDAMEGCNNWDEVRELSDGIRDGIDWKTGREMLDWLNGRDWEAQIENCIDSAGTREFVGEAKKCIKI